MFILVRLSGLAGVISCSLTAADHHLRSDPDLARGLFQVQCCGNRR